MDAVLEANEVVDSRMKQKKARILCKLDIEKVYDHVNREYLLNVLEKMRFGLKWIKFCTSSVKFSTLINVMEGLNNMLKTTNTNGWLRGFDVASNGKESLEVTHLQYADDTLIFCGAKEEQLK
ncbi:hypothetical protein H5410_042067 [Solanum commersonii]|uniref:Reverse transcriptase domain-containing protein n=1 Tax=Solanum commersonii TaxID=4109 RepID=A0A9J5XTP3_SOLCO|nr:hypothetical protein H5410_042067 [Solanum commersonii]